MVEIEFKIIKVVIIIIVFVDGEVVGFEYCLKLMDLLKCKIEMEMIVGIFE